MDEQDALKTIDPVPTTTGRSHSFYLHRPNGKISSVYKPRHGTVGGLDSPSPKKRARPFIEPGSEALAEVFFYELALHCQDRCSDQFIEQIPRASIERFVHPAFGPNHTVGARIEYVEGGVGLEEGMMDRMADESVYPVMFLDLLTANGGRHLGNFLLKEEKLYPIDAGCCLPSFDPEMRGMQFGWLRSPLADEPFSPTWAKVADAIEPLEIVEQTAKREAKRFPSEHFTFSPGQRLTLLATHQLLREGCARGVSIRQIALMQQRKRVKGKLGTLTDISGQPLRVGGELWDLILLCCLEVGYRYASQEPLPKALIERLQSGVAGLLDLEPTLRDLSDSALATRSKLTRVDYLRMLTA